MEGIIKRQCPGYSISHVWLANLKFDTGKEPVPTRSHWLMGQPSVCTGKNRFPRLATPKPSSDWSRLVFNCLRLVSTSYMRQHRQTTVKADPSHKFIQTSFFWAKKNNTLIYKNKATLDHRSDLQKCNRQGLASFTVITSTRNCA